MREIQFYVCSFRDFGSIFKWFWVPREPFWVTLGAFSALWGTFELLATPVFKIDDFTWERLPCFETHFWTIVVNFSCCFLGVFVGVLRVAFLEVWWFLGSLLGVIFGGIFEKFVFFWEKVVPSILNDPTTILLFFGAPRPPGKLQKWEYMLTELCCFFSSEKYDQKRCFYLFFGILGVQLGSPGAIFLVFFESLIFSEKRGQQGRTSVIKCDWPGIGKTPLRPLKEF